MLEESREGKGAFGMQGEQSPQSACQGAGSKQRAASDAGGEKPAAGLLVVLLHHQRAKGRERGAL